MAELVTVARPYAQAVFSLAQERAQLAQWSEMLHFVADVCADGQVQLALANPSFTKNDVENLLLGICGERLDGAARNLLVLLIRNDRLAVLPHIVDLYEALREQHENVIEAKVDSAFPLSDQQLAGLVANLERRTGRKVKASVNVVTDLIGGITVQIGDDLWDGSVRGQLDGLAAAVAH
ncbi:MAG TPA: F0F1 ATP synthase subunit delta [Burkholderiales bacterium]|nr:F0F1 ATP synthase subunit delta [Burkholderiales bacterium]